MRDALTGLRVLELGREIAAPYCARLLAGLGADVIKIEPPEGDSLRAWGPFPDAGRDPDRAGLFRHLNANKRGRILDLAQARDRETLLGLVTDADLVIEDRGPGGLESRGLGPGTLFGANPHLALVRISSFGQTGPDRDVPVSDLVLQAASGWVAAYDAADREPVRVGGRMPEFVAGSFAATAALTAVLAARQRGRPSSVDLSIQECLVGTLPYPMLMAEAARVARRPAPVARYAPFGVKRCRDGFVGINILTQAHWVDGCSALGVPEFAESRGEVSGNEVDYRAFCSALQAFLDRHDARQIVALCLEQRIPAAVVATGETVLTCDQLRSRAFFSRRPGELFEEPGVPFRLSETPASLSRPAPDLSGGAEPVGWLPRQGAILGVEVGEAREGRPFEGLRVLDLGTFWAGPYASMYLATLGADVIKVESIQRPDGFRFIAPVDASADRWYEGGALFQATNLGKRAITLDLSRDEGRALLLRLVERSDVLIENYSSRVMGAFRLEDADLRQARPDLITVRMPAYGLEGPKRRSVGWAMALAQAAGISWLTGDPSDPLPRNPGAFLDPSIAMHAAVAIQAALAHRRSTGRGQQIEIAQLETAVSMCPEPVIDFSQSGRVQVRQGNHSERAVPEGVYPCGDGQLVVLSVRDDSDWRSLLEALGAPTPAWASDPALCERVPRLERRAQLDAGLREWASEHSSEEVEGRLRLVGVPVSRLLGVDGIYGHSQLEARRYFETLDHPVTGKRRYPRWPMRFSFLEGACYPRPTPTLGQHNDEVLGAELGLDRETLDRLRREGVIGESPGAAT
ncbi:MAG: CaiB/BaiF CoA transferase family protein [Myxococcota bacterium]